MGTANKILVEKTPCLRIRELESHIRQVAETGEATIGTYTMSDTPMDLAITKDDAAVQVVVDDQTIDLDTEVSHLVPGDIGRWSFVCAQRFTALYCPHLMHGSRVGCVTAWPRVVAPTARQPSSSAWLIDPILLQAFCDAMRSRQ